MKREQFHAKEYVSSVQQLFSKHSNKERATGAKAYMRNQFEFFGISSPERRVLQRDFLAKNALPPIEYLEQVVKPMWKDPHREMQYFAMELCEKYSKKFPEEILSLFEFMITHKSWWDTVDFIASTLVGRYFLLYPFIIEQKTGEWMKSGNIWLMRTALLFQIKYKEKTNEKLLFRLILQCKDHPDFFIRKAIGWALRSYAYSNPEAVRKFVKSATLSALSTKEAMKHL